MNDGEHDSDQESQKKNIARSREMRDLLREYDARNKKRHGKPVRQKAPTEAGPGIGSRIGDLLKSCTVIVSDLSSTIFDFASTFFGRVIRSKIFFGLFVVMLLVLLAPRVSFLFTSHAGAYEVLHSIWDEAKQKQSDGVTSDSWTEYRSRSQEQITALVPILKQKADVNNPASMSLLWIARDYLPAVLEGPEKIDDELVGKIDKHFSDVELNLRRNSRSAPSSDWWMPIIIGVDVILILGAMWYFVGQRRLHRN